MNCAEVDRALASHGPYTPKQKQAIDEHLSSCRDCREAWAAYRGLVAEPIPATPTALRHRVMRALLATRRVEPRAAHPLRLGLGLLLLAGAAAASTWVYRSFEEEPTVPSALVESDNAPTAVSPSSGDTGARRATRPGAAPANGGVGQPDVAPAGDAYPLDAYSLVVLAIPSPALAPEAAGYFEQCHEDALRALRTIDGLNLIAGGQVSPYGDSRRPPEEIGRELGAGRVLVLSTASATRFEQMPAPPREHEPGSRVAGSCYADLIDVQTNAGRPIAGGTSSPWTADDSRRFAQGVAWGVRNAILEDRGALIARAQATVLDPAGGVGRVGALANLRRGRLYAEQLAIDEMQGMAPEPIPGAFTEAVVAAAVNIGSAAPDAMVRLYAWRYLRGVRDPNLTQALLYSLASDGDARVRCQAALTLGYLLDEPGVRNALMRASLEDPSTEPPTKDGCILSVRAAAERALQSDDELRAASLRTLLDPTLPSASRLAPLYESLDGRGLPSALDETAAQAVFEIGQRAEDARVRALAWESLRSSVLPAFKPTLIEDLDRHPSEDVRAAAATALGPYAGEAQVRAALEQARADPALVVRRAAQLALATASTE